MAWDCELFVPFICLACLAYINNGPGLCSTLYMQVAEGFLCAMVTVAVSNATKMHALRACACLRRRPANSSMCTSGAGHARHASQVSSAHLRSLPDHSHCLTAAYCDSGKSTGNELGYRTLMGF